MDTPTKSAGILSYHIGETPNIPMLFVSMCCCCWLGCYVQLHNIRTELKKAFPDIDDSNHILMVIVALWGLWATHNDLEKLEKENGLTYTPKFPIIVGILFAPLIPLTIADMMNRLNALAAKRG